MVSGPKKTNVFLWREFVFLSLPFLFFHFLCFWRSFCIFFSPWTYHDFLVKHSSVLQWVFSFILLFSYPLFFSLFYLHYLGFFFNPHPSLSSALTLSLSQSLRYIFSNTCCAFWPEFRCCAPKRSWNSIKNASKLPFYLIF